MHSAKVAGKWKKTLYNFSLVKYNACITHPALPGIKERELNYEKVICYAAGTAAGGFLLCRLPEC